MTDAAGGLAAGLGRPAARQTAAGQAGVGEPAPGRICPGERANGADEVGEPVRAAAPAEVGMAARRLAAGEAGGLAAGRRRAAAGAAAPVPLATLAALARRELVEAVRGRLVGVFALTFAALALALAWAGVGGGGDAAWGLTRTTTSLLQLVLALFPLVGLLIGANAFVEVRGQELLLAQPVGRGSVLAARYAGLAAGLALAAAAGFGAAGLIIGWRAADGDVLGYLLFTLTGIGLAAAALSTGCLAGIVSRSRPRALGAAVVLWFAWVFLYDLVALALLGLTGGAQLRWSLIVLLAANPVDAARVLTLFQLGADTLLGATGAALAATMRETSGLAVLAGALVFWIVAPLAVALVLFQRQDL